ncbi:MAG: FprA family A-type flavoprotein, partial [Candidatus Eisenbacteria bacterium]|nr:FprA family A-type flavoprotein [Candidatus Eisenbacteria bacterium]
MKHPFEAIPIAKDVYWVGAIDWAIREFHGYSTGRGTTYNAYVVMAERPTLIDTVKAPFRDEFLSRLRSVVDPKKIEIIVSNHSEMDHSGLLPSTVELIRPDVIYASKMGEKALAGHFHGAVEVEAVENGGTADLGSMELQFLETRMVHWPDSMFSYLKDRKLLFSQDGFGMHLASTERFDDELDWPTLKYETEKYFANILMPFAPQIAALLKKVKEAGIEPDIVAPDHGPVWREHFGDVFSLYERWCEQRPTRRAVVMYDTMWKSTAKMARALADGIAAGGGSAKLLPLESSDRSEVATESLEAGALLAGVSTMNNQMFPTMADALTYIRGLRPKNLIGAAFGSFGWSGEGVKHVNAILEEMGVELISEPLAVQHVPTDEDLVR